MKMKKTFCVILMLAMVFTLSGVTAFAEGSNSICTYVLSRSDDNNMIRQTDSAMVILSGEAVLLKLKYDSTAFPQEEVSSLLNELFSEGYGQNIKRDDGKISDEQIACCNRPLLKRYLLEKHLGTEHFCDVAIYECYQCEDCGRVYKVLKRNYTHSAKDCTSL